jgi:hypothetical protein
MLQWYLFKKLNWIALIPLIFSLVGFVLITLATFAGRQKGFMEEYDVVRVSILPSSHLPHFPHITCSKDVSCC